MSSTPMTIVRGPHKSHFTTLSNELLQNRVGLSCQARAILFDLLSRPPDWHVRNDNLAQTHKIGRDQVYKALNELREAGYATLETLRDPDTGRVAGTRWVIKEEPDRVPEIQELGDDDATEFLKTPKLGETRNSDFQDAYKVKNNIQTKEPLTKAAAPTAGPREGEQLRSDGSDAGKDGASPPDEGFARFEAAWRPWTQSDTREAALRAWRKLKPNEREEAADNAAIFVAGQAWLRHPKWASTYLSDRLWRYRASGGGASPTTPPTIGASATRASSSKAYQRPDGTWWLDPQSPQLQRWHEYERKTFKTAKPGCTRPSEFPPAQCATGLATGARL